MIKKGCEPIERRILLEEKGNRRHQENAELKLQRILVKHMVFGPVGFLSRYWQNFFDYEITGEDTIVGRKSLIISAVPDSPREYNFSFGKIWVDEKDHCVLKIEWKKTESGLQAASTSQNIWKVFREQNT